MPSKVTFSSLVQGRTIPSIHLTTEEFLELHADIERFCLHKIAQKGKETLFIHSNNFKVVSLWGHVGEMLVFGGRENRSTRKKPLGARKRTNKLSPHETPDQRTESKPLHHPYSPGYIMFSVIVPFWKISIPPPWMVTGNPKGSQVAKSKFVKGPNPGIMIIITKWSTIVSVSD